METKKRKLTTFTSEALFENLKIFEGLRLEAYLCPGGVWTIGYGHTHNVKRGDKWSEQWAEESLRKDIAMVERDVLAMNIVKTVGQLDALVSFVFNIGYYRFKKSTLYHLIRQGANSAAIQREFGRWVYAGGKKQQGLVKRRSWEAWRYFQQSPYIDYSKLG